MARDLINEPPNIMTPECLAQSARRILADTSVKVRVYGREETAVETDPERDGAARPLILAALESGAPFCAVSGDGWGGDAGRTTMAEYSQPGGITEHAEKPLVPRRRAWVDLNGDGQRECVLYVEHDTGDYIQSGYFVVFSEQV